jgi:hypothetical protein
MRKIVVLSLLALSGCSGTVGVELGKCLAGKLEPPSLSLGTTAPAPTGQYTFTAPAGSHFALCAW